MRTEELDYALPPELVAQRPARERDDARLIEVRESTIAHHTVRDWADLVPEGALVVVNDTRVLRARLVGHRRGTGGRVEVLLLRRISHPGDRERWSALGRANKKIAPGAVIEVDDVSVEVIERREHGEMMVEVTANGGVARALERSGLLPLPPYIKRSADADDDVRYQTVWAERAGSAAAPTAGLHVSEETLLRLRSRQIEIGKATLQVGPGTFRPITTENVEEHDIHAEEFEVTDALAAQIASARERGTKVVAVGTTTLRALESAADPERVGFVRSAARATNLFMHPGYRFRVVDALLTNFHVPKSSLLALVAAFAGLHRTLQAYREAVRMRYRFLSYGDAMWIPERLE